MVAPIKLDIMALIISPGIKVNDSKNALEIDICIMNPIMIVPMISNARTPIINVVTKSIRKLIFP